MKTKIALYLGMALLLLFSSSIIFSKTYYTCPMHANVKKIEKGKCEICGMALVKKEKTKMPSYTCPMHPDIQKNKKGTCPICGMKLVPAKHSKNKMHNHEH